MFFTATAKQNRACYITYNIQKQIVTSTRKASCDTMEPCPLFAALKNVCIPLDLDHLRSRDISLRAVTQHFSRVR